MKSGSSVLGINRRNIEYIYRYNDRKYYRLADDKLLSKKVLSEAGFPTPKLLFAYEHFYQLNTLREDLQTCNEFALKPARGMGGGGILIFENRQGENWLTTSGRTYTPSQLFHHCSMILSGVFSLDNATDAVLIEEKIHLDELLERITYKGIPDIRVIVFKKVPVMAMLRLPTKKSEGKANLHSGGIGLGIDLQTGITKASPYYKKAQSVNPDTGQQLTGLQIPYWQEIMQMSARIQDIIPLGYMGIDYVIDKRFGPQILEINVRPGLEIQNINGIGLADILENLDRNSQ